MSARHGLCAFVSLLSLLGLVSLASAQSIRHRPIGRFDTRPDTVVVYGPNHYVRGSSGTWTVFTGNFSISGFDPARRYLFRVSNGSSSGTNRVSQVSIILNGKEVMNATDVTTTVAFATKVVTPLASNSIQVSVAGTASSYIDLDLISTPDPAYGIHGPLEYVTEEVPEEIQPGDPVPNEFTDTFSTPSGAAGPYTIVLTNGAPDGFQRLSARLILNGTTVVSWTDFTTSVAQLTRQVSLLSSNSYTIRLSGNVGSYVNVAFTATDTTPPLVAVSSPTEGLVTEAAKILVAGTVTDETGGTVTVNGQAGLATPGSFADSVALPADGRYTITVHAVNSAGYGTDVVRHVTRDTRPPTLAVSQPGSPTLGDSVLFSVSWVDSTTTTVTVDGDAVGAAAGDSLGYKVPLDVGPNGIYFKAVDALGHVRSFKRYVFRGPTNESARDSAVAADSLVATEITPFLDQVKFLYTNGNPPLQDSVQVDSIKAALAAVVHGKVTARDFGPLPNVVVRVLGHDAFGRTTTRADGCFDLVVNGGARLTLRFTRDGYLEAQRQVEPAWQEYALVDSVALIGKTSRRSVVDLSGGQVARGRFQTDANGDRDLQMYFRQNTVARVARGSGDTASFSAVRVRATEYTVGSGGRYAMPAFLPPASAYTYCANFSLDEADSIARALGQLAPDVRFTNPVTTYVRNFLHLPVGAAVPSGYYDRQAGQWKAGRDGCVIRILSTAGGMATVDSSGDGQPDTLAGMDAAERTRLAQQYAQNDTLWRVSVDHFTDWDYNINMAAVAAQQSPTAGRAGQPLGLVGDACTATGSIIECENRVLAERISIVGTPYTLNYRSFRVPGDAAIRTLRIMASGDTLPGNVERVIVYLDVAGRRLTWGSAAGPNLVAEIPWDGRDVFGRRVQGSVDALVQVGYQYRLVYAASSGGGSFADAGSSGGAVLGAGGDRGVGRISWTKRRVSLGAPSAATDGLGGWTISPHHFYDVTGRGALYFGDGTVDHGERNYPIITTVASNLVPNDVAVAPDGTVYVAASYGIYRVRPTDLVTVGGGRPAGTPYVDNVLATASGLTNPNQLAVGPDGSLYFVMDSEDGSCNCQRVCKITPDGYVHSIAGTGTRDLNAPGDGGPATAASFSVPTSIALAPDGSVYVGDRERYTIRRIAPNGIITRYAGTGTAGVSDSTGKATLIRLSSVAGICVDGNGNLYVADSGQRRIRKVAPDGTLTTAASAGDLLARDVAAGPDGSVYIAIGAGEGGLQYVGRLDPDGTLSAVVGGGPIQSPYTEDGRFALGAGVNEPTGLALTPDGVMYIAEHRGGRVRKVAASLPGSTAGEFAIPAKDGSEVYFFDLRGRHLRTRDALTGAVRFWFRYDAVGRLVAIHDVNGDSTVIERVGDGAPQAIVGPYGQRTTLALDGNGYLGSVTNPATEAITLGSSSLGLLQSFTDAMSHRYDYTYADDGRLSLDTDPAGGSQQLVPSYQGLTRTVRRTTGEQRTTTYSVTDLYDGTRQRRIVGPDNLRTYYSDSSDAKVKLWSPDGMSTTDSLGPEPRFTALSPMVLRRSERLPSGIVRTTEVSRAYSVVPATTYNPPFVTGTWTENVSVNGRAPFVTEFNSGVTPNVLTITSPAGRTATATVDSAGRPLSISIPSLATLSVRYDGRGRLDSLTQGDRGWRHGYDQRGRLATIRDALGRTTGFAYDDADRVIRQDLPGGRSVSLGYDANGNLTTITPPGRPAHGFEYTPVNLTSAYRPPPMGLPISETRYHYNKDRQLTEVERPDGAVVRLGYDGAGRLASVTSPRGPILLSYDNQGRLEGISSPDTVTVTVAHDGPVDTMETWSGKVAGSVSVALDRELRVASQRVNGSNTVVFTYDADGLLTGAGTLFIHRRSDNGLVDSTKAGVVTSSQSYDDHGDLAELNYSASGLPLFHQHLERDALGRIVQLAETVQDSAHVYDYHYDVAGPLDSVATDGAKTQGLTYDPNGTRVAVRGAAVGDTATADYDDQDRLQRYGNSSYAYEANGELARKATGGDTTRYTYDALENLLKVRLASGDSVEYRADGRNRRVERRVNGTVERKWLYQSQLQPAAELDASGSVINRYVYGTHNHSPDLVLRGSAGYRVITDHLGSVRALVDTSSGAVVQRIDYDVWGVIRTDTAPTFQSLRYAGGLMDPSTGWERFGARDYEPATGRWTSKDGLRFFGESYNRYSYGDADPANTLDPSGEAFIDCALLRAELAYYEALLARRIRENSINPDRGHSKAIRQLRNRVDRLREQVAKYCDEPPWDLYIIAGIGFFLCPVPLAAPIPLPVP
ncbi:MAG: hypothetical protein HZC42_08710 [Candidatus Eisenbacteria bacterium]|nr:hypothetical protein [Candidatus Eisenbacteria bacterium]